MRIIPTSVHGVMDYLMGALLIAAPWLFGFADIESAKWVAVALGAGAILYSIFTAYELGLVPTIRMTTHLMLDAGSGIFLAASPWIFGFADQIWVPHVVLGIIEIAAAAMTQTVPRHTGARVTSGHPRGV